MALVTKQYLYETISSLIEGGDPSVGKKFEPRVVQAFIQQAINRKLKTEYLSVTLPSDETIPEGLILACYNGIQVSPYKGISRAVLPAMPIGLRRNMGVFFVGPAAGGNITPVIPVVPSNIITIEAVIGGTTTTIGTVSVITGITAGSSTITCSDFINGYFNVVRGNVPIPGIDPGDGSLHFTKTLSGNIITLSSPLVTGEYFKIQSV